MPLDPEHCTAVALIDLASVESTICELNAKVHTYGPLGNKALWLVVDVRPEVCNQLGCVFARIAYLLAEIESLPPTVCLGSARASLRKLSVRENLATRAL